jgi:hypothetical protein
MMTSVAQTTKWQMVQWLVSNEFEVVSTKPATAKYLLQYPHLSDWEKSIKEVKVHIGP